MQLYRWRRQVNPAMGGLGIHGYRIARDRFLTALEHGVNLLRGKGQMRILSGPPLSVSTSK